jgi:hypothetical protein
MEAFEFPYAEKVNGKLVRRVVKVVAETQEEANELAAIEFLRRQDDNYS